MVTPLPTAVILALSTRTVPRGISRPRPSSTVAPVKARRGVPACERAAVPNSRRAGPTARTGSIRASDVAVEQNLDAKLDFTRIVGRGGGEPEPRNRRRQGDVAGGNREIRMVEQIEELGAELQRAGLDE